MRILLQNVLKSLFFNPLRMMPLLSTKTGQRAQVILLVENFAKKTKSALKKSVASNAMSGLSVLAISLLVLVQDLSFNQLFPSFKRFLWQRVLQRNHPSIRLIQHRSVLVVFFWRKCPFRSLFLLAWLMWQTHSFSASFPSQQQCHEQL